jgi:hypothetical protein
MKPLIVVQTEGQKMCDTRTAFMTALGEKKLIRWEFRETYSQNILHGTSGGTNVVRARCSDTANS